ncbi:hypothetical protein DV737_g184, partial [Chaetothyriales sp. CBS 132003]
MVLSRFVAKGAENLEGKDVWLDNDDLRPLKLKDRTWTWRTYLTFWFSAAATVAGWYGNSAAQALGLSIYGAWWPTFNRAVMAIVWNGVNAVQGGQCVYVMLHSIFPSIANLPNVMGSGSALTSGGMIGFVIFWIVTCCFLVIPVPKMRLLVYLKLVAFIISATAMLGWTLKKAGGLGPVARQGSTVHGSEKTWLILRFLMLSAANCATFASNASDFQRYAPRPNDVILGNTFGFTLSNTLVSLIGNIVCSTSQVVLGELVWNPLDYLDRLQTESYTSANRAGCFFIAFLFAYSALFSSIFENSVPAGNDLAALFPKYISVRKGFYICQIASFALNPWYLLGSASIFVSFLASYQIFLSAITGVLLCNYYIISRGYMYIPDLFTSSKQGKYYFTHGWNIRAYVAYIIGVAPNFAGFLGNMGVPMPLGITRFYYFAYWVGIFIAGGVYYGICMWKPVSVQYNSGWREVKNYVRPEELEVIDGQEVGGERFLSERDAKNEAFETVMESKA